MNRKNRFHTAILLFVVLLFLSYFAFTFFIIKNHQFPETKVVQEKIDIKTKEIPTTTKPEPRFIQLDPTTTKSPISPSLDSFFTNQQNNEYLLNRLIDNNNCQLPCVWGISPGNDNWVSVRKNLENIGFNFESIKGMEFATKVISEKDIKIDFGFYIVDSLIQKVSFAINSSNYVTYVKYYSFDQILKLYGEPSGIFVTVGLSSKIPPPKETSFVIILYYESINTIIKYDGLANKQGENYSVCPSAPEYTSITGKKLGGHVHVFSAKNEKKLSPQEITTPFWNFPTFYVTTEDAFNLSKEEFFSKAISNPNNVCFITTLDNWK